jgi:septal ring factor EnvC (AmiA/AmiB activator)
MIYGDNSKSEIQGVNEMEDLLDQIKQKFEAKNKIIEEQKAAIADLQYKVKQQENETLKIHAELQEVKKKWKKANDLFGGVEK